MSARGPRAGPQRAGTGGGHAGLRRVCGLHTATRSGDCMPAPETDTQVLTKKKTFFICEFIYWGDLKEV